MHAKAQIGLVAGALTLYLVAICLLHPPSASAASTCPGRNGPVAVIVQRGSGRENIGIIEPDGQARSLFPPAPSGFYFSSPSFSCDGSKIVYEVATIEEGEGEGEGEEAPLLAASFGEERSCGSQHLEIVTVASGRRSEVETPHHCPYAPAFLSDARLIFTATPLARGRGSTCEIDADGSHLQRLFTGAEEASTANGRWFVSRGEPNEGGHSLFLFNAMGKRLHRLTPPLTGGEYLNPIFSPHGKWVVYQREIYSHAHRPNRDDLYIVSRNGTDRRRLTTGGESSEPTFSPDGRWIAFIQESGNEESSKVLTLSVEHPSNVKELVKAPTSSDTFQYPTWGAR